VYLYIQNNYTQHTNFIMYTQTFILDANLGIVQNSCITLMNGFDPLQMLTSVQMCVCVCVMYLGPNTSQNKMSSILF